MTKAPFRIARGVRAATLLRWAIPMPHPIFCSEQADSTLGLVVDTFAPRRSPPPAGSFVIIRNNELHGGRRRKADGADTTARGVTHRLRPTQRTHAVISCRGRRFGLEGLVW